MWYPVGSTISHKGPFWTLKELTTFSESQEGKAFTFNVKTALQPSCKDYVVKVRYPNSRKDEIDPLPHCHAFACFTSAQRFYTYLMLVDPIDREFVELISAGTPRKLYFDVDLYLDYKGEDTISNVEKSLFKRIEPVMRNAIVKILQVEHTFSVLLCCTNSRLLGSTLKISWHLVTPFLASYTNSASLKVLNDVQSTLQKEGVAFGFDSAVYHANSLRMPLSYKCKFVRQQGMMELRTEHFEKVAEKQELPYFLASLVTCVTYPPELKWNDVHIINNQNEVPWRVREPVKRSDRIKEIIEFIKNEILRMREHGGFEADQVLL